MKTFYCWLISCLEVPVTVLFLVFLGTGERYSVYFQTHEKQGGFLAILSCLLAAIPAIVIFASKLNVK